MRELEQLKREIGRLERGRGRRYPSRLRERITAHTRARRDEGASWASIGLELDVPFETLQRWIMEPASTTAMVPVEVISPTVHAETEVAVVSPTGWRLEGLDVRDAVAVLRALS